MSRETAIVICPGRGVYGRDELGYLARRHGDKAGFIDQIDAFRTQHGRTPIRALDAETSYSAARHATSANASALIYACALADLADIDRDRFDIVAVTGNSLGWYLTLAAAGALDEAGGVRVVDTMGALMEAEGVGGQLVYPVSDADWRPSQARADAVDDALSRAAAEDAKAFLSIKLGGMAVLAGDEAGLASLERNLPQADERFPFRLARHAAFHTPLLAHVSRKALSELAPAIFNKPRLPMIDGRGVIHQPCAFDPEALHDYTFGEQITSTYDFSKAVEVALKEFAPDRLIVLGPGATMGPPIAQELIKHHWRGLRSKSEFVAMQKNDSFLLAMGLDDQRARVISGGAKAAAPA